MPVCPHAEVIKGATPGDSGIVCRVMRREDYVGDGIVEGHGVGVHLRLRTDAMTIMNLCTGDGERRQIEKRTRSGLIVKEVVHRHFSACPIFQAAAEAEEENRERVFEPLEKPSTEVDPELVERGILRQETAPASVEELVEEQRG